MEYRYSCVELLDDDWKRSGLNVSTKFVSLFTRKPGPGVFSPWRTKFPPCAGMVLLKMVLLFLLSKIINGRGLKASSDFRRRRRATKSDSQSQRSRCLHLRNGGKYARTVQHDLTVLKKYQRYMHILFSSENPRMSNHPEISIRDETCFYFLLSKVWNLIIYN